MISGLSPTATPSRRFASFLKKGMGWYSILNCCNFCEKEIPPRSVLVHYCLVVEVSRVGLNFPFDVRRINASAFLWKQCYRSTRVYAALSENKLPHHALDCFDLLVAGCY